MVDDSAKREIDLSTTFGSAPKTLFAPYQRHQDFETKILPASSTDLLHTDTPTPVGEVWDLVKGIKGASERLNGSANEYFEARGRNA